MNRHRSLDASPRQQPPEVRRKRHVVVAIDQIAICLRDRLIVNRTVHQSHRYDDRAIAQWGSQRDGLKGQHPVAVGGVSFGNNMIFAPCFSFLLVSATSNPTRFFLWRSTKIVPQRIAHNPTTGHFLTSLLDMNTTGKMLPKTKPST